MSEHVATLTVADSLELIIAENVALQGSLAEQADLTSLDDAARHLSGAKRVFVLGAGRSGIALNMTAMRLMHLGLSVHVVGEITAPAITAGDVLLTASGSGTTSAIVRAAETAAGLGANVVAITTAADSPLAKLASVVVVLPAATKQDHSGAASQQYAGGLFEQAVGLVGDAIFHSLWKASGATAEQLWTRHSNLE